jgi:hypothetical protein
VRAAKIGAVKVLYPSTSHRKHVRAVQDRTVRNCTRRTRALAISYEIVNVTFFSS